MKLGNRRTGASCEDAAVDPCEHYTRAVGGRFLTYQGEDERVMEMSVERQLHHVSPQPQQLLGLSQTRKDVTIRSRKIARDRDTRKSHVADMSNAAAGLTSRLNVAVET